jgi:Tol biopolymer transport system component/imidazolonepropionase-like amidohydrolase
MMRPWDPQPQGIEDGPADNPDEDSPTPDTDWEVNDPPWERTMIDIDTTEGTWMNLDVSPDGQHIVFDLLGDIYIMPITGGAAKALTRGMAWNMQPRFSPDGALLAFTSDRGGGDNIWVMDRDGSNAQDVTKESFRLLNSPAWTPDGRFIAARKHFTSRRSLGAGEIWLYHVSGGSGLQMTSRPNDQKDVGEPAFSADGRYLYYSQDATAGKMFEYNKDPNGQIYIINRLDRHTQRNERFITGPGGAIRPTPSPDGRKLAFVRRVRYQSVLFVHDIASGHNTPLYDKLERDMQETWAVHGVYPAFAWTPDNKALIVYAKGTFHRIDATTGTASNIPFHVKDQREVTASLRHAVEVAPPEFKVRVVRWPVVLPGGKRVVFQALGHLYVKELPDGAPRRLTRQTDHFEFHPAISSDGEHVAYTTWNDDNLGQVRVVSLDGNPSRVISPEPGHYVEPAFSPDGAHVVYRKTRGGRLRAPEWSRDPGLYRVSVEGGPATRLSRSGADPFFANNDNTLYYSKSVGEGGKSKRALAALDLQTRKERIVVDSDNATRFRISPDGKWLAFKERFNAHLVPLTATGRKISVGPKNKSVPTRQVSSDVGDYLHFAADSQTLYWNSGPKLFHKDLDEVIASFASDDKKDAGDDPTAGETAENTEVSDPPGIDISMTVPADRPEGTVVLRGARIITMRGDEVIENASLVLNGNRIESIAAGDVTIPDGATVLDVSGNTIIPGLVDVHDHGPHGGEGILPQRNWSLYAKMAFGVTTVHDPSHDTHTIFASSELGRAGLIVAPRIYSTGTILYGAAGPFKAEVDSLADARKHLQRLQDIGAFSVKSYNQPRRDQRQQVLAAARELGMMVVPEGGSLLQHNLTMVVDGHTGVEHAIPIDAAYSDVLTLWPPTAVGYTPTLVVAYGGLWGENYWYQKTPVWENERLMTFVPRFVVDPRSRRRTMVPDEEFNHIRVARVCKALLDRGVKVNLGAHGQLAGLAHHWELWMFSQGGMTALEVIRCGTLNPAHYVGLDGDIGSIEPGKLADIVVLHGNPLEDIRQTANVRYTVANGRVYDAATMNQIGNYEQPRGRFFWEPRPGG